MESRLDGLLLQWRGVPCHGTVRLSTIPRKATGFPSSFPAAQVPPQTGHEIHLCRWQKKKSNFQGTTDYSKYMEVSHRIRVPQIIHFEWGFSMILQLLGVSKSWMTTLHRPSPSPIRWAFPAPCWCWILCSEHCSSQPFRGSNLGSRVVA